MWAALHVQPVSYHCCQLSRELSEPFFLSFCYLWYSSGTWGVGVGVSFVPFGTPLALWACSVFMTQEYVLFAQQNTVRYSQEFFFFFNSMLGNWPNWKLTFRACLETFS